MTRPPGPLLFARYAYPPNSLGLCGADVPADAARVRGGGRVRRRARRARAHLRGRVAVPRADRRRERHRRSARRARRRGLLGRERAARPRPAGRARASRRRALPRPARAGPRARRRRRRAPARSRTTASTSSPSTPGSGSCARGSSTSRCASSTSAGRPRRSCVSVDGETVRCSPGRCSSRAARLALGAPAERTARWSDGGLAFSAPRSRRPGLAALGLRLRRAVAGRRALPRPGEPAAHWAVNPVVARSGIGAALPAAAPARVRRRPPPRPGTPWAVQDRVFMGGSLHRPRLRGAPRGRLPRRGQLRPVGRDLLLRPRWAPGPAGSRTGFRPRADRAARRSLRHLLPRRDRLAWGGMEELAELPLAPAVRTDLDTASAAVEHVVDQGRNQRGFN